MPYHHAGRVLLGLALLCAGGCVGPGSIAHGSSTRLVYRVEDLSQVPTRVTTQVIDLASPQRARSVLVGGDGLHGPSLGGDSWSEISQYLIAPDGSVSLVQDVAPEFAGPFTDLIDETALAEAHGLASSLGAGSVDGVACRLVRTRGPLDVGPVVAGTAREHVDSCIAADGLLLQDTWTLDGSLVRRRTLISHGPGPGLSGPSLFNGRHPLPSSLQTATERVKDEPWSALVRALGIPLPGRPLGLAPGRATAVIQPDPSGIGIAVEGAVFSWTDSHRLVLLRVQRGLTTRLQVGSEGVPVTIGDHAARVSAVAPGLRVRFAGPAGLVATVTADLPSQKLFPWVAGVSLG